MLDPEMTGYPRELSVRAHRVSDWHRRGLLDVSRVPGDLRRGGDERSAPPAGQAFSGLASPDDRDEPLAHVRARWID
jgi:hypothetical protein